MSSSTHESRRPATSTTAIGSIAGLYIASASGAPMRTVERAWAVPGRGLEGDRYFERRGRFRASGCDVTLVESEVIAELSDDLGLGIDAPGTRRNIVTRGIRLNELVGCLFRVGPVELRGVGLCEPCVSLAPGSGSTLMKRLVHRGGLRAAVLTEGEVRVGDPIEGGAMPRR